MKKILLFILLILSVFLFIGCKEEEKEPVDPGSDDPVVEPDPKGDPVSYEINVENPEMKEGETQQLSIKNLGENDTVTWISGDEILATISSSGVVTAIKAGEVVITAVINDTMITTTITIGEVKKAPIRLEGKETLTAGEIVTIKKIYGGEEFDVEWSSSNSSIAMVKDGVVFALQEGEVEIKAVKVGETRTKATLNIKVNKYVAPTPDPDDVAYVRAIMENMSIEEMIGQMFIGTQSTTVVTETLESLVKDYKLGNFIFMGFNTPSGVEAAGLARGLQELVLEELSIPAFISIDQETGRVCRLTNGGTRFLGNMASAATGDPHDRYLIGEAVGDELKTYGINFNLAPVLDVNNNPNNPVINNRSFSDNSYTVAYYGTEMMKGLMASNVMSCAKHFPGHGNTATDSHYGLPVISTSLDSLYRIELAPFIAAIYNGIDAIMTTHILFSDLDNEYPATLSYKILTGQLREKMGYGGLIVTDAMEMQGITNGYGDGEAAVLAVNAGADILCYTDISRLKNGITAVIQAYYQNKISRDRIEDAVERILLKKKKYGLFEDCMPKEGYENYDLTRHTELNLELAKKAVTVYKGSFSGLDKTKKTIIFSSKCSYQLKDFGGTNNSFGYYAKTYLESKGFSNIEYVYISSITQSDVASLVSKALGYDQIVIAVSDANSQQVNFVSQVCEKRSDAIIVALNLPYDLNKYEHVENYICLYENTPIMNEALVYLMNGEYKPTGISPIKLNK